MQDITVIIADDHPIFRAGVREILTTNSSIHLLGEAGDGLAAYQMILAHRPQIAILDLEMPILSGLDVCQKVLKEKHQTEFIILTMHKEKTYYLEAVKAGVKGYLLKDNASDDLIKCIEAVAKGNQYLVQQLRHFQDVSDVNEKDEHLEIAIRLLTATEKIILKLIGEGKTSVEISQMLFVSPNTVDNHRSNMSKKLNLEGKNSLLKFAMGLKPQL